MNEKINIVKHKTKKNNKVFRTQKKQQIKTKILPLNQILHLQHTVGNQAVQRLLKSGALQTKLRAGKKGDKYEREADMIAEQVIRMPESHTSRQSEKKEKGILLQIKGENSSTTDLTSPAESGINLLNGKGQPLPESTRKYFEPRFAYDFSEVRIHKDSEATSAARALNARAFTLGNNIVFNSSQYSPETSTGKSLLAHELTHVVQQGNIIRKKTGSSSSGSKPSKKLNIPVIGQHWMQIFYWKYYWKKSINNAILEAVKPISLTKLMPYSPFFKRVNRLAVDLESEIMKCKNTSYSYRNLRPIRKIHLSLYAQLRGLVSRKTLRRLSLNYWNFISWWKQSGNTACYTAASKLMRYAGARPRRSFTPFSGSKRVLVRNTSWYRSKFGNNVVRLYKGRYLNYQIKYSKTKLLTAAKAIIRTINSGKPVHVRVLTAYIHKNYGRLPGSIHSLVINSYTLESGTLSNPIKVKFGFLDPDNGKKGTLILDPGASENEFSSRFQSNPQGTPSWSRMDNGAWFFGGNGAPWRYQVIRIDY